MKEDSPINWLDLGMAFAVGFAGSVHCVGMCGGIIGALSMEEKGFWLPGLTLYHLGRIATYALLGLTAGLLGGLVTTWGAVADLQRILSLAAGALIILFALQLGGWIEERLGPLAKVALPPDLINRAATGSSPALWGLVGLINGLLPCGMVYAAIVLALKQGDPLYGLAIMALFGIGTIPAMTVLAFVIRRLSPSLKTKFTKGAAILLFLFGLFTIYRGIAPTQMHHMH